jgi:hypothetical protein
MENSPENTEPPEEQQLSSFEGTGTPPLQWKDASDDTSFYIVP